MILGGGTISEYSFSRALGINPSAAQGTVIMDNTGVGGAGEFELAVGDYVVYSFDAIATFYGIITETGASASDPGSGLVQNFTVNDNRIRLGWQMVYAAFNIEDDIMAKRLARPVSPAAPGDAGSGGGDDSVDMGSGLGALPGLDGVGTLTDPGNAGTVRRRYKSLLPANQESGIWTWHDAPFTAREILNFAFAGAWGDYSFSRDYHADLNDLILTGIDHSGGCKLSNFIAEINEKAGLELTIEGARNLVWHRKGEGLPPLADATSNNRSSGEALTANDTKIRVIGDRTRVQVMNVELEPDWQAGYQPFIDELAWRREIADVFELPVATKADQADLAAKCRQVTVYQYAKAKADVTLLDYRAFGQGSRVNMAAWMYIQELVYRSYRIPPTHDLYGIPLSSLEMADSLLCATDIEGEAETAKQVYARDPVEFYPSAQAQIMHQGQPLDLINSRDIRLFYRNTSGDLRTEWTAATDFEVDPIGMSVRFRAPVFIDGLPSEGKSIYLKLNKGEGGGVDLTSTLDGQSDYLDIVVPNPDFEILPAAVKASFCFLLGRFQRVYGSGPRRGGLSMPGLGPHLLDVTGDTGFANTGIEAFTTADLRVPDPAGRTFKEIQYEDGGNSIEKADAAAASKLALSPIQATGGFTRNGAAGTVLSGMVDRIDLRVSFQGAITETVGYTKANSTGIAFSERTLTRLQRTAELFPGQEALRQEIRQYRLIAHALRKVDAKHRSTTHVKFVDVFAKPVGSESPSTTSLYDADSAAPTRGGTAGWRAGDIVWVDGKGTPSATGQAFGGVLVSTPVSTGEGEAATQTKNLAVATRGIVPVRIRGTIAAGGVVLANKGAHYAGASGDTGIGQLMHGEAVPVPAGEGAEVLAMVNLGAGGGGGAAAIAAFTLVTDRPGYVPVPGALAANHARFYLTWGLCQGRVPDNWTNVLDVPLGAETYRYVSMKAYLAPDGELAVSSCEWVTGTEADTHETPDWPTNGDRPAYCIIPLGTVYVSSVGEAFPFSVGGSIQIAEYIAGISAQAAGVSFPVSAFRRGLAFTRT